ncbi:MAG TPA: DNA-processing protein DprA [Steroidobacteraceae bacterium]|nr:DNA-processing protein DprA [Steroidobacteraceae bacterium]
MDERRITALFARLPSLTAQDVRAAFARAGDLTGAAELIRASHPARAAEEALLDADLRWLEASGAAALLCTSALYPAQLAGTAEAPPVLYVLGDVGALATPQVAVVGSRRATPAGLATAHEMAVALVRAGLTVASGLAVGIDAACHEGALEAGGTTLAVCAHGLELIYPRRHRSLAQRIRESGALVSRFSPGTPPARWRFPARGRMLSGLALATLVVEAARTSGSLHTAHAALRQGRPVYAVPGSIRSSVSAGCHALIKSGAQIAESPTDVLRGLDIYLKNQSPMNTTRVELRSGAAGAPLDKASEILLDALGFEPVSLNTLVERTGLSSSGIASLLLALELAGRVAPQPGGRYSRLS